MAVVLIKNDAVNVVKALRFLAESGMVIDSNKDDILTLIKRVEGAIKYTEGCNNCTRPYGEECSYIVPTPEDCMYAKKE